MNLEQKLKNIGKLSTMSLTDIKKVFAKEKATLDEKFGDALLEDKKEMVILKKIARKYSINYEDIEKEEEPMEEDLEMPNMDELLDEEDDSDGAYARWAATIPDPIGENKEFEKLPSLIIEIGPTYTLKLVNPKLKPFTKEFDGDFGKYTKHMIKVILKKVSDEAMYDMEYTKGDLAGNPAFINGEKYCLWMDDKCSGFYKKFWMLVSDGMPDDRLFTFRKTKNGKYNVFTFKEAKK